MARKSQFFANDSDISAAAGVSIKTPILIDFLEKLIFFFNSLITSFINFFALPILKHLKP